MKTAFKLLACLMAIECVVGISIPPARRTPIEIPDNGDGLYVVQTDENDTPISVEFTPIADINTKRAVERADTSPIPHALLDKRAGITCSGGTGNTDIDSAQGCLANAAGSAGEWGYHWWVWCKSGSAVAYACNYQANPVSYAIVADMISGVDNKCGNYGYGYNRCTNGCGINDLAIGRSFNGDSFCASGFTG